MKNKKYIIIGLAIIVIILIVALVIFFSRKNNEDGNNMVMVSENNVTNENAENNTSIVDQDTSNQNVVEIENMKNEINATGNTDIYYVDEEYDGRKILQVKPDVQFDVDLAGIIKNTMPEENEISELVGKAPTDNGIWISEQSRESFSDLSIDIVPTSIGCPFSWHFIISSIIALNLACSVLYTTSGQSSRCTGLLGGISITSNL